MTATKQFLELVSRGKQGENAFINWCKNNNIEYVDLSDNTYWQKRDVDFACRYNGTIKTVEVKTDTRLGQTGNFAIEFYQHYANTYFNSEFGWAFMSKADMFATYDSINKRLYIYNVNDLLLYCVGYQEKYRFMKFYDKMNSGKTKCRYVELMKMQDFVYWCNKYNKPIIIEDLKE